MKARGSQRRSPPGWVETPAGRLPAFARRCLDKCGRLFRRVLCRKHRASKAKNLEYSHHLRYFQSYRRLDFPPDSRCPFRSTECHNRTPQNFKAESLVSLSSLARRFKRQILPAFIALSKLSISDSAAKSRSSRHLVRPLRLQLVARFCHGRLLQRSFTI